MILAIANVRLPQGLLQSRRNYLLVDGVRPWLVAPNGRGRGRQDYVACESRDVPEKRAKAELTRDSSGGYIVDTRRPPG